MPKRQNDKNIDEYIAAAPEHARKPLEQIRKLVHELTPEATEKISYGIPTFYFNGNLVHFAGYEKHIGFYPGSSPISEFKNELAGYKTSKGTIQFPIDKPLPLELIKKITKACIESNRVKK